MSGGSRTCNRSASLWVRRKANIQPTMDQKSWSGQPNPRARPPSAGGLAEGLVDVRPDIAHVLQTDGKADIVLGDAGGLLLLEGQLLVGRGGRMDDKGL